MLLEFQNFFQASPISWVQYIGGGQWEQVGSRIGRLFHTFEQKSSHCMFIEVHRHPQFTCQADTVADGSLILSVALLVHPRGTTHFIVDCHEFTGSQK